MRNTFFMSTVTVALLLGFVQTAGAESDRDPTRPYSARSLVSPATGAAAFKVSAVFVSTERRVAVVNGQRVIEGDTINGAIVVEINKDGLRLNLHGKELTTRLLPAGLRK
ncbi:MAG: general secretion pathway protein GspB [Gammaproteobacteria bacterium]|nr:general secretion pathway protein GspB [Gammaproteobacteria bacterium]MDH3481577.1 general secretion pathway protein GspB [Gammaproteobacteria bacterium]